MTQTRILVLGAAGMLGHTVLRFFANDWRFDVVGTVRTAASRTLLPPALHDRLIDGVDVEDSASLAAVLRSVAPTLIINCVGVVKQLASAQDPLTAIPINSLLPHRLARHCRESGARLIHVSTDCVFAGTRGMYRETDVPDAGDLYGRSKLLGEIETPEVVTLRTSIIGPELRGEHGLLAWFLAQRGTAKGFTRAIFSGLPTVELARVMRDFVLPRPELSGLYHVGSDPISKYELLTLVKQTYGSEVKLVPDGTLVIDRSLDSSRFCSLTGYSSPLWRDLVCKMREFG